MRNTMELVSTILLIASSLVSVSGQTVTCRASVNCTGGDDDDLGVAANGTACCLGNPAALAYSPSGSEDCFACVVVGFIDESFSGVERVRSYLVLVDYQKGREVARQDLMFNVRNTPGTARAGSSFDYRVNTERVRALASATQPDDVEVYLFIDTIAQEPNETFTLTLDPITAPTPRVGLFLRNTIQVTIVDSDNVQISFTESRYRANEPNPGGPATALPILVAKTLRIASRIELVVVPLTVQEARNTRVTLPPNIPENNRYSPPFADSNDFNNTNITVIFEPDEDSLTVVNEKSAPVFVTDDAINEATEQVFVVELHLVSSLNPALVDLTVQPSSLCRIIDNHDSIRIGFELSRYTYTEPQFEEFIDEFYVSPVERPESRPIFIVKHDNVTTEQAFQLEFQFMDSVPSGSMYTGIHPATANQDYSLSSHDATSVHYTFGPFRQRIPVIFHLFSDTLPEGTEAFQITLSSLASQAITDERVEILPTPEILIQKVAVIIEDDDFVTIGFANTSYTVSETVGVLQVDVQVFNLPDNQSLPATVNLVIQSVSGSAMRESDHQEITAASLDVVLTFNDTNRQQSFSVTIFDDSAFELDIEDFMLELRFDPFITPPSNIILHPNVSTIEILDDDSVMIGFLNTSYTVAESDGVASIQIGAIRGTIQRPVVIQISTGDISATNRSDYIGLVRWQHLLNSTRNMINVTIINDNVFELTESFGISLSLPDSASSRVTLAADPAQVTILDDDELRVGFQQTAHTVSESIGSINIGVSFVSGSAGELVPHVNASTVDGTATGSVEADYGSTANLSISFPPANRTVSISVTIIQDVFTEINEMFSVVLSSVFLTRSTGGATIDLSDQERGRLILIPNVTTVKILDDDVSFIGFQSTIPSALEGSGILRFDIAVLNGILGLGMNVPIIFTTQDDSAQAGLDYNTTTSSLIVNSQSTSQFLDVGIIDDNIFERPETFFGRLRAASVLPWNIRLEPNIAVATIIEDKQIAIGFSTGSRSLKSDETNGTVTVSVQVFNGTIQEGATVSIRFTTADDSAYAASDYTRVSSVLTFSSSSIVQTVQVPIIDDSVFELSEAFTATISLSEDSDNIDIVELMPNSISITIIDDDVFVFGFSPLEYEVHESDGSVAIEIFFIRGIPEDYQPLVLISTHNGTATEGRDFAALASSEVTFTTDNRIKRLAIPIMASNSTESSEWFTITLDEVILIHARNKTPLNLTDEERARLMLNSKRANVTILDDNMAVIGFLDTNLSVHEGEGALNFTVGVVWGYLDTSVTVYFTSEDASARAGMDYNEASRVIIFSGDLVQNVSIQIISDGIVESSETFFGLLSSTDGMAIPPNVHLEPTRATATIIDDNDLPIARSSENSNNITVLVVVLVCILVLLIVIVVSVVIVMCFRLKKNKRKAVDLQEHVYDSVSVPAPSTQALVSKSVKLTDDDEVKEPSVPQKFELSDNVAYGSYKPLSAAETTPNTD